MLTWSRRGRPRQAPPGLEVGCPSPSLCSPATTHGRTAGTKDQGAHAQPCPPGHLAGWSHLVANQGSFCSRLPRVCVSCAHTGRLRGYIVLGRLLLRPRTPVLMQGDPWPGPAGAAGHSGWVSGGGELQLNEDAPCTPQAHRERERSTARPAGRRQVRPPKHKEENPHGCEGAAPGFKVTSQTA